LRELGKIAEMTQNNPWLTIDTTLSEDLFQPELQSGRKRGDTMLHCNNLKRALQKQKCDEPPEE
jgi:hypothetical protein